jgi:pimeloyl-ACP methyl ester carboxylesterase
VSVRSRIVETERLRTHLIEWGTEGGVPVVLLHGNLSTGRFFSHLTPPEGYRLIAPDMRGFGESERKPLDATRGLREWADDTHALVRALGIERPVHLAGWSTGGAAVAAYALDRPVASLTLVDPVSPYGFGGTHLDGTPCSPDYAGSGGGVASPDFVARLAEGDRSTDSSLSPRNVLRNFYWSPSHAEPREEELLDEVLKSAIGDDFYPGDATPSEHWPGSAPGTRGINNALSPKYCDWSDLPSLDPKPPVLWTHGSEDAIISDTSGWDVGLLGSLGHVPGWPGEEAHPPQPMVAQISAVLDRYREAGGSVRVERFDGSGHFPPIDAAERWSAVFFAFLEDAEVG